MSDCEKIEQYLKKIQSSPEARHLFGHKSAIMMGVGGDVNWDIINDNSELGTDIYALKSDVREVTGELPAIVGYDAFKLILDVTDSSVRKDEVNASIAVLKLFHENGVLIAFNWHMQPLGLPGYRERAYRMDEFQNNPYIALMKEKKPFYRIANGFADKDWWWNEFETKRLAPMAESLELISEDGSGIILRPFHEFDGDWFWWGLKWLEGDESLIGKDAYIKVFLETARYMKQRLPGVMIAFSPDKLDFVSHEDGTGETEIAQHYRDALASYLPKNKDELALIDIYGMDLYTEPHNPQSSLECFRLKLRGLTLIAQEHDKIAAITETGNRGLPAEEDERQASISWYNNYLLSWISDPEIHVAYVLIWQNWSNNRNVSVKDPSDGYFVPFNSRSPSGKDFILYVESKQTIMLREFKKELTCNDL